MRRWGGAACTACRSPSWTALARRLPGPAHADQDPDDDNHYLVKIADFGLSRCVSKQKQLALFQRARTGLTRVLSDPGDGLERLPSMGSLKLNNASNTSGSRGPSVVRQASRISGLSSAKSVPSRKAECVAPRTGTGAASAIAAAAPTAS